MPPVDDSYKPIVDEFFSHMLHRIVHHSPDSVCSRSHCTLYTREIPLPRPRCSVRHSSSLMARRPCRAWQPALFRGERADDWPRSRVLSSESPVRHSSVGGDRRECGASSATWRESPRVASAIVLPTLSSRDPGKARAFSSLSVAALRDAW